ncbi:MAG: dockerin type I domain-containing protein [Phycisphaerales bacterium]|nr:dockerin type I domain-containing protein [Phycisphaerales bacterium]
MHPRSLLIVSSSVTATVLSTSLFADLDTQRYSSSTNYEFVVSHMPDFDQNRAGLGADSDGDPGGMYCVPTATSNLFAYIANHGYTYCAPGQADWQLNSNHADATDFIDRLADEMNTSPTNGTTGGRGFRGARNVLQDEVGSRFVIEDERHSLWNVVTLRELSRAGICEDAIQTVCYGKYATLGYNWCDERVIKRSGGHCMTFVGGYRNGSTRKIKVNDPGGSGDENTVQSTFETLDHDCPWYSDLVVSFTTFGSCLLPNQGMNRIQRNSNDSFLRLIDARLAIRPANCYSWHSYDDGTSCAVETGGMPFGQNDFEIELAPAGVGASYWNTGQSLTIAPNGRPFLIAADGSIMFRENDEEEATMRPVPLGELDLPPADGITFCSDRTLVLRHNDRLIAITGMDAVTTDPDADRNPPTVAWEAQAPFQIGQVIPSRRERTSEDDSMHTVLAFSPNLRVIFETSGDPEIEPQIRSVPASLPLDPERFNQTIIVEDGAGTIWFAQEGDRRISTLDREGQVSIIELPVEKITGFDIDDLNQLLVADEGRVRCFGLGARGLEERGAEASPFVGQLVGMGFKVDRSSSNYDPKQHSEEQGWFDSPEVAQALPCPEDLNGDGQVNGGDLALVLSSWGENGDDGADLNGDGIVNGADMALILSAWGKCL